MYVFIKPTLLLYVVMHDPFHFLQDHEKNIMVKIHYVLVWYTNTSTTTMSKDVNKKSRECVSERDHTVNPFSPLLGFFKTKKPQRFTKKKGISIELPQNIQTEIVTAVMCHAGMFATLSHTLIRNSGVLLCFHMSYPNHVKRIWVSHGWDRKWGSSRGPLTSLSDYGWGLGTFLVPSSRRSSTSHKVTSRKRSKQFSFT